MILRVLDIESTGLDPALDRIVEIATVDLIVTDNGEHAKPRYKVERGARWSSLVNPGMPIPPEASAIHHITDSMVADAPPIGELLSIVTDGKPALFAAHNRKFDMGFVRPAGFDWLCTYKLAVWLWDACPSHTNQCLRYWLKLKFAEDPGPPHRASGDAYVTAAILHRIFTLDSLSLEQMLDISNNPVLLPRMRFGKHQGLAFGEVPTGYLEWCRDNVHDDEDLAFTVRHELQHRRSRNIR